MRMGNLNLEITERERESREVMELALMYDIAAKFMEKRHIHLFTALYVP